MKEAEQTALKTLSDHRAALNALANALIERESVEKSDVDAIVAKAERSSTPRLP